MRRSTTLTSVLPMPHKMGSFLLAAFLVAGCSGGGSSGTSSGGDQGINPSASQGYPVSGHVQKGPLIFGTEVLIQELDNKLQATGKVFITQTTDDLGSFTSPTKVSTRLVELRGDGFYMDELTGGLSGSRIMLRAVADLSITTSPVINILTTLQMPRLKRLLQSGIDYQVAYTQSQSEVLSAFGIDSIKVQGLQALSSMAINGGTDQDSVLLATSAILSQMAQNAAVTNNSSPSAEMSYLLSAIASDLDKDGHLDSSSIITARNQAASQLDLASVRSNVETYFANKGQNVVAPRFEEWVDKDNSGVLPRRLSTTPTAWTFVDNPSADQDIIYTSNTIVVSGIGSTSAYVKASPGATIVKNGSPLSTSYTTAADGDSFALRTLSGAFSTSKALSLQIGSVTVPWTVTTRTPKIGVALGYGNECNGFSDCAGVSIPQTASSTYFALPVQSSESFTAKNVGLGLALYEGMMNFIAPQSVSIYSDNGGIPGNVLASSNTFGKWFNGLYNGITSGSYNISPRTQAYLGSSGVTIAANTPYWVVVKYANSVAPSWAGSSTTPFSTRKMSSDGSTWMDWSGTSGNSQDGNPNLMPQVFLSN